MARVLKMAHGRISLAHSIHWCPSFFFISFVWPVSPYCEEYVYTYTYLTALRLYMNYRCYQITLQWNIFTWFRSSAKCWLEIYHWGAFLAVTGWKHDMGQNILQSPQHTADPRVQMRTGWASRSQYNSSLIVFGTTT